MVLKRFAILLLAIVLVQGSYGLTARKYRPTDAEGKAGPLVINLHQMPTPSTTQIGHLSAKGKEWISITPGNVLLEMHNGSRSAWTPPSFSGYPSTGFTGNKWKGISYSTNAGNDDYDWQSNPPASTLSIGYTSYSIHGGDDGNNGGDGVLPQPELEDVKLGKNFFFVQTPSYLRYMLPACPNFTPEDQDLTAECPKRVCKPGEWKFSLIGLLAGTNVNSLKTSRATPTASLSKTVERDISKYKTLIYSTVLDVGAMGENVKLEAEFPDGSKKKFNEISPTMNINEAKLRIKGPESKEAITLTFVKHYGVGTFKRKVSDFVCTQAESASQGDTFGKCTRDVTGMKDDDDGKPMNSIGETAPVGTVGDPVLTLKEVKEMLVTIRPASCEGRPSSPTDPWPEKNSDCPWWYTASNHLGKWAVDDEKYPGDPESLTKDEQTKCESGYCFHIDFHVSLGGTTLADRTIFGNPDNAINNGIDTGTFFVYDPTVDGGPLPTPPFPAIYIIVIVLGVLIISVSVFCFLKKRKKDAQTVKKVSGIEMKKNEDTSSA